MTHAAYTFLQSVKHAAGFNVQGATGRNVNQHMREYTFPDQSKLRIYRAGLAAILKRHALPDCITGLRVNSFGKA